MSEWTRIDSELLSEKKRITEDAPGSIQAFSMSSPYEMPIAIRVIGTSHGHRRIEFKYLDDEPLDRIDSGQGVWLLLGKKSRRLFGLEIAPAELSLRAHGERNVYKTLLRRIVSDLASKPTGARENYAFANKALFKSDGVYDELVEAGTVG
jgi:hypothetical protein